MNSPGVLNMKAGEKLVSTILAASTECQESRLGTTLGKEYYSPNVRVDGLGATRSPLGLFFQRLHQQRDAGLSFWGQDYVLHETTAGASGFLPGTRRRNHPTSRSPIKSTDLEIELTKRTVPSWRSIISFGCLSLVKSVFVFVRCFSNSSILK